MDPQALAQVLTSVLAPVLPYLLKAGEKAAEEAGKRIAADTWEQAKALWARLRPKVEAKPAAQEAVLEVAANPQDDDALAVLRWQLRKILAEDPALAADLATLLPAPSGNVTVASGDRSVAIGGNASGNIIITGDQNVVER